MLKLSHADALAYARQLPHAGKRAYAEGWIAHVFEGASVPTRPCDVTAMAAQAVRLRIGYLDERDAL